MPVLPRGSLPFLLAAGLLVGCTGGGGDTAADTADTGLTDTGDTAVDTGPATGLVLAEVSQDGQPFLGATVAFQGPDGSVLETRTVDQYGMVQWSEFPAGGSVTAAVDQGDERFLLTASAIQPGDFVVLDPNGFGSEPSLEIDVELPGAYTSGSTTPTSYEVRACEQFGGSEVSDPATPQTVEVPPWCRSADGTVHLLALAMDGDTPLAWSLVEDLQPGDTASATFDFWEDTWTSFDLTVENLPTGLDGDPEVSVFGNVEGVDVFHDRQDDPCTVGSSQIDCTGLRVPDGIDNVGYAVTFDYNATNTSVAEVSEHRGSIPASATLDLGAGAFGRLHETAIDPAAREIQWTAEGPLEGADVGLMLARWEISGTGYTWILQAPGDVESPYPLPMLPASLDAWWTDSGTAFSDPPTIFFFEDSRGSYADYRASVLTPLLATRFQGTGDFQATAGAAGP